MEITDARLTDPRITEAMERMAPIARANIDEAIADLRHRIRYGRKEFTAYGDIGDRERSVYPTKAADRGALAHLLETRARLDG